MKRTGSDDALRCSFCHKSQDAVGKLISTPSNYPRAFICDECITVCNSILEDDKPQKHYAAPGTVSWLQRRKAHDLVDELPPEKLDALVERIADLLGAPPDQVSSSVIP